MTNKNTKRALISSLLVLCLCFTMLIGTTFAWFTDSATSGSNVIKSGRLDIVLEYWNGTDWVDGEGKVLEFQKANGATDEEILWEPGCTYQLPKFRVRNVGNLATKILIRLNGIDGDEKLMEAIDLTTTITNIPDSVLNGSQAAQLGKFNNATIELMYGTPDGTLIFDWSLMGEGVVAPNSGHTDTSPEFTITGHMHEDVGNEYQNLMIQGISITVLATQQVYEYDSFGRDYDANLPYPDVEAPALEVSDYATLQNAIESGEEYIVLRNDIGIDEPINVNKNITINGNGKTITRAPGYTGNVFSVAEGVELTLEDTVVDGGAVWVSTLSDGTVSNGGATATGNLITANKNAKIILEEGAILQNNDGAHAVNLGTRIGATLTMNGGAIMYNRSDSGAVWGGGHITINSGAISYNMSTGAAGAIRMVSNCNLTMNGGEITNNVAAGNGGAIWGYGASIYTLNSGKISNNTSGGVGGGIYTGDYSEIYMSGDFEFCGNTATESGALRITNYTIFNMTGGKISGNVSTNNPDYNGFYAWCPRLTITGGELADNITLAGGHTPTVGGNGITGTIHFNIGTNHNTINLTADFGEIKFVANETVNFNFKPAAGYTYTEGDEAKLVCLNDGYSTYWDTATSTFKLKAN